MTPRLVLLAAFAFCMGCTQPAPETPLERVSIAFQKWVGYGQLYLAQEKGFCREEGIELLFVDEQVDTARRDAFKQGILDCEAGTIDLLVSKRSENTGVVAVLELDESYGADGIAASREVTSVKDLAGKPVAFARDDVGETFISHVLNRNGMSLDDIKIVPTAVDEAYQRFLEGQVEAVATWEPYLSQALTRPGAHILVTSREEGGVVVDMLNVREDLVKEKPALVKKLMRAWFKALAYYRAHPDEAEAMIAKNYGVSAEKYHRAVQGLKWDDYRSQLADSKLDAWRAAFDFISELKLQSGRISRRPDAKPAFNTELLQTLYEDRK